VYDVDGSYIRGCVYLDKSFKKMSWGKPINHNEYRADVFYGGVRYRKRSKNREVCIQFLRDMKQGHLDEYLKECEECGSIFELGPKNRNSRFCCPGCRAKAERRRRSINCGMRIIDERGRTLLDNKSNRH